MRLPISPEASHDVASGGTAAPRQAAQVVGAVGPLVGMVLAGARTILSQEFMV